MKLNFLKNFAQLQNAIFLLLIIAMFSILGTIIEQDKSLDYYQNQYSSVFFLIKSTYFKLLLFLELIMFIELGGFLLYYFCLPVA